MVDTVFLLLLSSLFVIGLVAIIKMWWRMNKKINIQTVWLFIIRFNTLICAGGFALFGGMLVIIGYYWPDNPIITANLLSYYGTGATFFALGIAFWVLDKDKQTQERIENNQREIDSRLNEILQFLRNK